MNYKNLNEEIEKVLNEISYETKKSYLAKRKAQYDKALKAWDKANRLVSDTERQKKPIVTDIDITDLKFILERVKNYIKYNDVEFGDIKTYGDTTAYIRTVLVGMKCEVSVSYDTKYLIVKIDTNTKDKNIEEKFSLNEYTKEELINKAINFIFSKFKDNSIGKDYKMQNKINNLVDKIKKVLSRFKGDNLDKEDDYFPYIEDKLRAGNIREENKIVTTVKTSISSTRGLDYNYTVVAVSLTSDFSLLLWCYAPYLQNVGIFNIDDMFVKPQDMYEALEKILEQLRNKTKVDTNSKQGRSKVSNEDLYKVAEDLYKEVKGLYYDKIKPVEEYDTESGIVLEIDTFNLMDWEGNEPTERTMDTAESISKRVIRRNNKKVKIDILVGNDRLLTFKIY